MTSEQKRWIRRALVGAACALAVAVPLACGPDAARPHGRGHRQRHLTELAERIEDAVAAAVIYPPGRDNRRIAPDELPRLAERIRTSDVDDSGQPWVTIGSIWITGPDDRTAVVRFSEGEAFQVVLFGPGDIERHSARLRGPDPFPEFLDTLRQPSQTAGR